MRPLLLLAAALSVSGAAPATPRFELRFGATPVSPIGPPVPCPGSPPGGALCHRTEPDYVANYETVVPRAIRSCGAAFAGFQAMTEGAEIASFDVDSKQEVGQVVACIEQRLPQTHVLSPGEGVH